jgi:hypothetical protein
VHVRVSRQAAAGSGGYPFEQASVAIVQAVEVKTRFSRWRALLMTLTLALGPFIAPGLVASALPRCTESLPGPAVAAALKPSDVLLTISTPRPGGTVSRVVPADSITLSVDYWGPPLVPADEARAVDEYHLAYFLDADATPYIGTLMPIPRCHPQIVHSALTQVNFDNVPGGSHSLTVLLVGSNSVSVNPPVSARVTFVAK